MPSIKIERSEQQSIRAGIHDAVIESAVDAVSQKENEMLKLSVKVGPLKINAWVVFTPKNIENVEKFAIAIGKKVVEGKTLVIETEDCIGKAVKVELGPGNRINDKTGDPYLEIKRWLPASAESDLSSDEIPF